VANRAPAHSSVTPVAAPAQVSQATAVEQARAVAEVAAAVQVAQQNPRSIDSARRALQASCSMMSLAEEAFYDFNQGGRVHGPTATLARELGRCWGNFQSGSDELRRDAENGVSEMKAWAWDLETNSRRSVTFVVPHERDGTGAALKSVRDIRNNNNNWAARGEREMILSTLPAWFVQEAITLCQATLAKGDGTTVEERRDRAVTAFESLGVSLDRIERKMGTPKDRWSVFDLAQLTQVHKAISRGAVAIEDEFPAARITSAELAPAYNTTATPVKKAAPKRAAAKPAMEEPPVDEPHPADSNGQMQYAPDDDGRPFDEGEG
jgi:hypothetical protein